MHGPVGVTLVWKAGVIKVINFFMRCNMIDSFQRYLLRTNKLHVRLDKESGGCYFRVANN